MPEIILTIPRGYKPVPLPYRDELLTALRSGQFKKGKIYLYNQENKTHCVLGVLSHIQGRNPEAIGNKDLHCGLTSDNPCFSVLGVHGAFPQRVKVELEDVGDFGTLTALNDASDLSFSQIATLIEALYSPVESK